MMVFENVRCELCKGIRFNEDEVVAFHRDQHGITLVTLRGRAPWAGIGVVCTMCVRALALTQLQSKAGRPGQ